MAFLSPNGPPKLSDSTAKVLEAPVTHKKAKLAILQLKVGKSPGPDGLTPHYYKTLADILILKFIKAFDPPDHVPYPARHLLEAHILVILKEGIDPALCSSYRPISLLNAGVKINAKTLANKLQPLLPTLMSLNQVGFTWVKNLKTISLRLLILIIGLLQKGFSLSTDAEKFA